MKSSGMSDVVVGLQNIAALAGWSLHVGLGAGLSPSKHKDATTTDSGTIYSGGTSIRNYVGLSSIIGSANYYGIKLSYLTRTERTYNNGTADYKLTGGNTAGVGAFFESVFSEFSVDVAADYEFNDPVTKTYQDGTTAAIDAYKTLRLTAGAQYQITAATNLRAEYAMAQSSDYFDQGTKYTGSSETQLRARLRFEF